MARFDAFSELFDRYADIIDHRYRPWLEQVLPQQAGRALDAGCGAGRYTTMLADRCQQVLAVDIADGMLQVARQRRAWPNIRYQQRDLRDLSAQEGPFDVVLAVAVVHHLPDPEQAVRHLARLVAPAGRLLLIDMVRPTARWTRPRIVGHAVAEAAQQLAHRGSLAQAATVLRLWLHPAWAAHITTSNAAPRPQVRARYARTLPDARLTDLYASLGVCWQAPDWPPRAGQPTRQPTHAPSPR